MEVATQHVQSLGHMQPLVSGTMLYPGRCGVWQQPVANSSSMAVQAPVTMTELPKESIIANTDFTTTSLIAKRRLSSKKRRMQHQNGSTGSEISTESSAHSPVSSATGSPAVCTPKDGGETDPFGHKEESSTGMARTSGCSSLTSSSSSSGIPYRRTGGQFISMAPTTHPVGLLQHNQVANPVLSQLQQGLNYRFLQEQSLLQQQAVGVSVPSHIEHPQPITDRAQRVPVQGRIVSTDSGSGFKWCVAHVMIANQIRHHKQQQIDGSKFHIHPSFSSSASFQSPPTLARSHTPPGPPSSSSTVVSSQPHLQPLSQQPQQQPTQPPTIVTSAPHMPHLALMQYSLPQTTAAAATLPPGYLAIPYPSLDLQLRMNPHQAMLPAHIQLASRAIPVMTDSIVGLNPAAPGGGGGGGGGCVQVMGTAAAGISLQQQHHMAQLAMAHGNPTIMHGPSALSGSWVAPVPVMNSCVINHPFQPDTMAAPWVK